MTQTDATAPATLEVKGLRAAVGDREILRGIDLTVQQGQIHALMGPNGSGKSTLSNVIMGRPGYRILEGSVTFNGEDITTLPTNGPSEDCSWRCSTRPRSQASRS